MKARELVAFQVALSKQLDDGAVPLADQIRLLGGCLAYAARRMGPAEREASLAAQFTTILMMARGECDLPGERSA